MGNAGQRGIQPIAQILGDLLARRGYARVRGQEELETAWREVAGEATARYTRVGQWSRGVLEVRVANSILLQELAGFHKQDLLEKLRQRFDGRQIRDIRFRLDEGA